MTAYLPRCWIPAVEAMRISPETTHGEISPNDMSVTYISGWMMSHGFRDFRVHGDSRPFGIEIRNSNGTSTVAQPGDYIVQGPQGFYPLPAAFFDTVYERQE